MGSVCMQYERTLPMHNFSADACGPAYITVGKRLPTTGLVLRIRVNDTGCTAVLNLISKCNLYILCCCKFS